MRIGGKKECSAEFLQRLTAAHCLVVTAKIPTPKQCCCVRDCHTQGGSGQESGGSQTSDCKTASWAIFFCQEMKKEGIKEEKMGWEDEGQGPPYSITCLS